MRPDRVRVVQCRVCGDVIPVERSDDGTVRPIRTGESCECGAEEFRLLSEAEVDRIVGKPARGWTG